MIPTTAPAKRKMQVNSRKGVLTIVVQASVTQLRISVKPVVNCVRNAAIEKPPYQLRESKRPMIPTTPPAKRKMQVKRRKGLLTIVAQAETTLVIMTVKPSPISPTKFAIGEGVGAVVPADKSQSIVYPLTSKVDKV